MSRASARPCTSLFTAVFGPRAGGRSSEERRLGRGLGRVTPLVVTVNVQHCLRGLGPWGGGARTTYIIGR